MAAQKSCVFVALKISLIASSLSTAKGTLETIEKGQLSQIFYQPYCKFKVGYLESRGKEQEKWGPPG